MTFEQIAKVEGVSRTRIWQIYRRAMHKLGRRRSLLQAIRELMETRARGERAVIGILLAIAALGMCAPARAQERPRPAARVHDRIFLTESLALTLADISDGVATSRDTRMGIWEAPFPRGSSELLGRWPTPGRYALVMGAEQAITEFAAWRFERSRFRSLRFAGHALMWEGTAVHLDCAIHDFGLQTTSRGGE